MEVLWDPITPEEIKAAKLQLTIAPGPDGLTPRQLRAVLVIVLFRVINLMIWCARLPKHLMGARTIFIPKKPDAVNPVDFPISRYARLCTDHFTVFLLRRLIALWSSARSRGPSGQASMVAETTPFFLILSFAVDMS